MNGILQRILTPGSRRAKYTALQYKQRTVSSEQAGQDFLDSLGDTGRGGVVVPKNGGWVAHWGPSYQANVAQDKSEEMFMAQLGLSQEALGVQKEIAGGQLKISKEQLKMAREQWDYYKTIYQPVETKYARTALSGLPADYYVGRASQDVAQSYDKSRREWSRQLESFGLNPSDPRYAAIMKDINVVEAAADAGARTNTRLAINDTNYARMSDVSKTGRGIPTEAASVMSGAAGTAGMASNSASAGYDSVMNAYSGLGNMYQNQASYLNGQSMNASNASAANKQGNQQAIGSIAGTVVTAAAIFF